MATNNKFHLTLPASWSDQSSYNFIGPAVNSVQHRLTMLLDNNPGNTDLLNYALDRIAMLKATYPDMVVIKDEEKSLPGGTAAYEFVYRLNVAGSSAEFTKFVYILRDGKGYTFTASFSKYSLKTIGLEVDQIINSLVTTK